jgi:ABC-type polysaccharide/polyol phosphate transport system ATPase subunit
LYIAQLKKYLLYSIENLKLMAENVTPVILTAMELSLSFGEQIIFENASLSIHEGDRIGLVGRNGVGK